MMDKRRVGRPSKIITFAGKSLTVKEWADHLNVGLKTIYKRLNAMPIEQALAIPRQAHNNRRPGQRLCWSA